MSEASARERVESAPQRGPLLDVRDLGVSFTTAAGRVQATRDIAFSVAPGERIGVVGESGCGKTITGQIGRASCRERVLWQV